MAKGRKKTLDSPASLSEYPQDPTLSLKSFIEGEEKERQRLSRELHDGIGQYLVAVKMKLESLLYMDPAEVKRQIGILKTDFDRIVDEVRRISNNLMPEVLESFGIIFAIRNLCVETGEQSGLAISLDFKGDFESLNQTMKTYLFRIAQEALNNIVRHAHATVVDLQLIRERDRVFFSIRDNGKGFIPADISITSGHGVNNMRERVNLLKGTIDISSDKNKGTQIQINVPVFH
jgi:signal transduction histidine kinase